MLTAIEEKLKRERAFGHMLGVADAIRVILDGLDPNGYSSEVSAIVTRYPEAAKFIPIGSRDNETRPMPQAKTEYREGEVYYWRPGNYGQADCSWRVPRPWMPQ